VRADEKLTVFVELELAIYLWCSKSWQSWSFFDLTVNRSGKVTQESHTKHDLARLRVKSLAAFLTRYTLHSARRQKTLYCAWLTITVIEEAVVDIGHAPADQSNYRRDLQGYAAWEIHPVMKLTVQ